MTEPTFRYLTVAEVIAATSLSRATIYRYIEKGAFPAPVRIGPNRTGWRSDAVDAWMRQPMGQAA